MADTILSVLVNTLAGDYGLTDLNYTAAITGFASALQATNFADAPNLCSFGLPAMSKAYTALAIGGMEAAQSTLSLMQVGLLPARSGLQFNDRGAFLYCVGNSLSILMANAAQFQTAGFDPTAFKAVTPVDRLAALLLAYRGTSPGIIPRPQCFAPLFDNLLAFDMARVALQASVPTKIAPSLKVPNTANGTVLMAPVAFGAFGQR